MHQTPFPESHCAYLSIMILLHVGGLFTNSSDQEFKSKDNSEGVSEDVLAGVNQVSCVSRYNTDPLKLPAVTFNERVYLERLDDGTHSSPSQRIDGQEFVVHNMNQTHSDTESIVTNPEEDYIRAECKGTQLSRALGDPQPSNDARVSKVEHLVAAGYQVEDTIEADTANLSCFRSALVGFEAWKPGFVRWRATYRGQYHRTFASYEEVISPESGIIIAWSNHSPELSPPPEVPQRLSDMFFVSWSDACDKTNTPYHTLKHVIRGNIVNGETIDIIDMALESAGSEITRWPGTTLPMQSSPARAILGSPNGYGVAFMLLDHGSMLGEKNIESVTVFLNDRNGYSLMFNLS